jgi:hypothetical protein
MITILNAQFAVVTLKTHWEILKMKIHQRITILGGPKDNE